MVDNEMSVLLLGNPNFSVEDNTLFLNLSILLSRRRLVSIGLILIIKDQMILDTIYISLDISIRNSKTSPVSIRFLIPMMLMNISPLNKK